MRFQTTTEYYDQDLGVWMSPPVLGASPAGANDPRWFNFPAGATAGDRVYVTVEGFAVSGLTSGGAKATRWVVASGADAGGVAIVHTSTRFGPPDPGAIDPVPA
jgi:hypothetical protein